MDCLNPGAAAAVLVALGTVMYVISAVLAYVGVSVLLLVGLMLLAFAFLNSS